MCLSKKGENVWFPIQLNFKRLKLKNEKDTKNWLIYSGSFKQIGWSSSVAAVPEANAEGESDVPINLRLALVDTFAKDVD